MTVSGFSNILKGNIEYESIKNALATGRVPMGVIGLTPVHKAHYISSLCDDMGKKALIICPDEGTAAKCATTSMLCQGELLSTLQETITSDLWTLNPESFSSAV